MSDDVHVAEQQDVDDAVAAASAALPGWSATLPSERAKLLLRIADLIDENAAEFLRLESLCSGKPVNAAGMMEIGLASSTFRCR